MPKILETTMALKPPSLPGPLTVRLVLDSHVYLYSVEFAKDCGDHTKIVAPSSKTIDEAVWLEVDKCPPNATDISFGVTYVGVHSEAPNHSYVAELAVLDAAGDPLQPYDGFHNPLRVPGQTGPKDSPADSGRFGVVVG